MDSVYIVLDGNESTLIDNYYLKWQIPSYYFKNIENKDDVFMTLISCQFNGVFATAHNDNIKTAEVICDVPFQNYSNTNNNNVLAIVQTSTDNIADSTSCDLIQEKIMYKINQFNDITISVLNQGEYLDWTTVGADVNKDFCKFILKLDYREN
jgi:hypothetical protein